MISVIFATFAINVLNKNELYKRHRVRNSDNALNVCFKKQLSGVSF